LKKRIKNAIINLASIACAYCQRINREEVDTVKSNSWVNFLKWIAPRMLKTIVGFIIGIELAVTMIVSWQKNDVYSASFMTAVLAVAALWRLFSSRYDVAKSIWAIIVGLVTIWSFFEVPDWMLTVIVATIVVNTARTVIRYWVPKEWTL